MFDVQRRGKRRSDEWGRRDASPLRRSVAVSMVFEIAHGRVINKCQLHCLKGQCDSL